MMVVTYHNPLVGTVVSVCRRHAVLLSPSDRANVEYGRHRGWCDLCEAPRSLTDGE